MLVFFILVSLVNRNSYLCSTFRRRNVKCQRFKMRSIVNFPADRRREDN